MKTEQTPNQINLTVMRDNEIDTSYVRAAQRARIAETLKHTAYHVLTATSHAVGALVTPFALDIHDSLHHSDLRAQYFQRMHEEATEEIRSLVEL